MLEHVSTPIKAQRTEAEESTTGLARQPTRNLPPPLASAPLGQGEIILVLGNLPMKRGFVGGILRQLGYRVLEAGGMTEAQSLARAEQAVHLLLLDLTVIDTRHLEFALWFRCTYPETRILVVADSLWELDFHVGVSQKIALLARPFTPLELARVVWRTLA